MCTCTDERICDECAERLRAALQKAFDELAQAARERERDASVLPDWWNESIGIAA